MSLHPTLVPYLWNIWINYTPNIYENLAFVDTQLLARKSSHKVGGRNSQEIAPPPIPHPRIQSVPVFKLGK